MKKTNSAETTETFTTWKNPSSILNFIDCYTNRSWPVDNIANGRASVWCPQVLSIRLDIILVGLRDFTHASQPWVKQNPTQVFQQCFIRRLQERLWFCVNLKHQSPLGRTLLNDLEVLYWHDFTSRLSVLALVPRNKESLQMPEMRRGCHPPLWRDSRWSGCQDLTCIPWIQFFTSPSSDSQK